jgi:5-formyltetrahydrofolate cyclo-ligase
MTKAELRREYLNRQKNLSATEVESLSQQIATRLFDSLDMARFQTIHCFLPIAKNGEINTWLIIKRLWLDFPLARTVVPRINPVDYTMTSHLLTDQTPLSETRWGVPEPEKTNTVDPVEIDCVLLPLLAYDRRGYRVGYGKGFYDRFLTLCRPDVRKVGLSYHDPVACIDDCDSFDIPLDCCITPQKLWKFA